MNKQIIPLGIVGFSGNSQRKAGIRAIIDGSVFFEVYYPLLLGARWGEDENGTYLILIIPLYHSMLHQSTVRGSLIFTSGEYWFYKQNKIILKTSGSWGYFPDREHFFCPYPWVDDIWVGRPINIACWRAGREWEDDSISKEYQRHLQGGTNWYGNSVPPQPPFFKNRGVSLVGANAIVPLTYPHFNAEVELPRLLFYNFRDAIQTPIIDLGNGEENDLLEVATSFYRGVSFPTMDEWVQQYFIAPNNLNSLSDFSSIFSHPQYAGLEVVDNIIEIKIKAPTTEDRCDIAITIDRQYRDSGYFCMSFAEYARLMNAMPRMANAIQSTNQLLRNIRS